MKIQLVLFITFVGIYSSTNASLVIENADRVIDLTSQLAKISLKLTIKNNFNNAVKHFLHPENPLEKGITAYVTAKGTSKGNLVIKDHEEEGKTFYKINLSQALQPGKTVVVTIDYVKMKSLIPHPASITQRDRQLIRFYTTQNYYSGYTIKQDKTTFKLGSSTIESYTKVKSAVQSDSTLTYGPFEEVNPYSNNEIVIHFENNSPFLTITKLTRTIEVSHWGNVAVEEDIDMLHTGALLKGSFSRYEYQRDGNSGLSSIKSFKTILPASASGVYYRDNNGNISTSQMRVKKDAVELDLRPRYPLFGGWKTRYTLGYNVPSYEYLYHSGNDYLLKMRLIDHIFDDMVVEDLTVNVILPEGTSNINLNTPYSVERGLDSSHSTYLDLEGRPVITFSRKNLVENHIQDFELSYNFPRIFMLREPILVFIAFYVLFLAVIVYVRLDFSIYKRKQE